MAIKEEYVEVILNGRVISHYENLGYGIPRNHNGWKNTVPHGTRISVKVEDVSPGSTVKVTKICDLCNTELPNKPIQAVLRCRRDGMDLCRRCSSTLSRITKNNRLIDTHPEIAKTWHPVKNKQDIQNISNGSSKKVWWLCGNCGNEWMSRVADRTKGKGCPSCSMSKGERKIYNYLKESGINFKSQVSVEGLVGVKGGKLLFDFGIGNNAMFIEYDGEQHFNPHSFNSVSDTFTRYEFKVIKEHDRRKNQYCEEQGIPLIRIKYTEFDEIEKILDENLSYYSRPKATF